jgi:hypothetical protein
LEFHSKTTASSSIESSRSNKETAKMSNNRDMDTPSTVRRPATLLPKSEVRDTKAWTSAARHRDPSKTNETAQPSISAVSIRVDKKNEEGSDIGSSAPPPTPTPPYLKTAQ